MLHVDPSLARLSAAIADHGRLALIGPPASGKSSLLRAHRQALLDAGVPAERVLALVASPAHADATAERALDRWIRAELEAWWPRLEASGALPERLASAPASPFFLESSAARYLLARVGEAWRCDEAFKRLGAPGTLLRQLERSHAEAIAHGVPLAELAARWEAVRPGDPTLRRLRGEAQEVLEAYRTAMLAARLLDRRLARELFCTALWPDPVYHVTLRFSHVLIDDAEGLTPPVRALLQTPIMRAESAVVALNAPSALGDQPGADPHGTHTWLEAWPRFALEAPAIPAPIGAFGTAIARRLAGEPAAPCAPGDRVVARFDFTSRAAMIRAACEDAAVLTRFGTPAHAIRLIAPRRDPFLIDEARTALAAYGLCLAGPPTPLRDHAEVRTALAIASAAHPAWQAPPLTDPLLARPEVQAWLAAYRAGPTEPVDAFFRRLYAELLSPDRLPAPLAAALSPFCAAMRRLGELDPVTLGRRFLGYCLAFEPASFEPPDPAAIALVRADVHAIAGPPVSFQLWLDLADPHWRSPAAGPFHDPRACDGRPPVASLTTLEAEDEARLARLLETLACKTLGGLRLYASSQDAEGRDHPGELPSVLAALQGVAYAGLGGPA